MTRIKPLLKFPHQTSRGLLSNNRLGVPPVLPGIKGRHKLLPGWKVLGWTHVYEQGKTHGTPVGIYEKVECLPAPSHTNYGPGRYWLPQDVYTIGIEVETIPKEVAV